MSAVSSIVEDAPQSEKVFGIDFWKGSTAEAVSAVGQWLSRSDYFTLSFANPEFVLNAQKDEVLIDYLQRCRTVFADGVGILWASRLQGGQIRERITGTDFQWEIFKLAAQRNLRVFLYGGKPGVADRASEIIRSRVPELHAIGHCDGYLEEQEALAKIAEFKPDVLVVCLGNPRQERWIARHGRSTGARLVFGNGGALDFIAGQVRRAPQWMLDNGLEWLWRLCQDPSWFRFRRQIRLAFYVGKLAKLKLQQR
jgi:N-acetylglucosaminyldiphosphoundecaprenol N-acetyl-beta-D-mannosaminyltransferase